MNAIAIEFVYFALAPLCSLYLLYRGIRARKGPRARNAWVSVSLLGATGVIWSIIGAFENRLMARSWPVEVTEHYLGGVAIGIFISILISGQFRAFAAAKHDEASCNSHPGDVESARRSEGL
jgi:hypothetical protein